MIATVFQHNRTLLYANALHARQIMIQIAYTAYQLLLQWIDAYTVCGILPS